MGYSLTQNQDEIKIDVDINDIDYQETSPTRNQPEYGLTLEHQTNTEANEIGMEPQLEAKGL